MFIGSVLKAAGISFNCFGILSFYCTIKFFRNENCVVNGVFEMNYVCTNQRIIRNGQTRESG